MKPKYAPQYWDRLFASSDYGQLAQLSSMLWASETCRPDAPDYGLPQPAFVFVEALAWFAQAIRSGAWTYFEATPPTRQQAVLHALKSHGPAGFAEQYEYGMRNWQHEDEMAALDRWMTEHDDDNTAWLWTLARAHRPLLEDLCA